MPPTTKPLVDSACLQGDSDCVKSPQFNGDWRTCFYEQSSVEGKHEKYTFPCPPDLECCGNKCCDPVPAGMPLWLLLLILFLLLLLFIICLGSAIYICCKRKKKSEEKKLKKRQRVAAIRPNELVIEEKKGSSHYLIRETPSASTEPQSSEFTERSMSRETQTEKDRRRRHSISSLEGSLLGSPPQTGPIVQEKFVPSPMEEVFVPPAKPIMVQRHSDRDISTEKHPLMATNEMPDPQQAKIAYYRPFVPSPMEESVLPTPERNRIEMHHSSEFTTATQFSVESVDKPDTKQAQHMYCRPGFENVPAY